MEFNALWQLSKRYDAINANWGSTPELTQKCVEWYKDALTTFERIQLDPSLIDIVFGNNYRQTLSFTLRHSIDHYKTLLSREEYVDLIKQFPKRDIMVHLWVERTEMYTDKDESAIKRWDHTADDIFQNIWGLSLDVAIYSKANNYTTPDYDKNQNDSWIIYLDANNLYGWAMSQCLPKDGFHWFNDNLSVDNVLKILEDMENDGPVGMALEVDISYPEALHDKHNDMPYLPERMIPSGSKFSKLTANLQYKKNYVVHYTSLKQAINAGIKLEKVHRIIKFNQSPWLKSYIQLNTDKRKLAVNDFQKDFYKLMNNSVFGKTMENLRLRMDMELVSCPKRCSKLINRNSYKSCTIYNENLAAVHLHKEKIKFDKPIFIGFSVLDISKTLMYSFHYETMKTMYDDDHIELCYMDTDSLMYFIKTRDFYKDVMDKAGFLEKLDTSNFPTDHPCYTTIRKKEPGRFSDETGSASIWEHVALRSKSYSYNLVGEEHIKAKGVSTYTVKNHMSLRDHKLCLFKDVDGNVIPQEYTPYREMRSFRSYKHEMFTISSEKLALNRHDDKRFVLKDQIHTLAHGHYRIMEI